MFLIYKSLYKNLLPVVIANTTIIGGIIGEQNKCFKKRIMGGIFFGIAYPISLPICFLKCFIYNDML